MNLTRYQRNLDISLVSAVMGTAIFGVFTIYSATHGPEASSSSNLYFHQIIWMLFALGALATVMLIPLRAFHTAAYLIYGGAVLFLLIGLEVGFGRWVRWGSLGFQPSEFAKIAMVLGLARYLSTRGVNLERPFYLVVPILMVLLPMGLIAKQPDLGTSLVYGAVLFPMLYWAGLKPLHLFFLLSPFLTILCAFHKVSLGAVIVLLGVVVYLTRPGLFATIFIGLANLGVALIAPFLWFQNLHEYQRKRILSFLNPEGDIQGSGYQLLQSKVAIGSGGVAGKGFMEGTQTKLAFLPAQHTDFVFAVIGEELGFLGAMGVLGLFFFIIWRSIRIAALARGKFSGLVGIGMVSIFVYHVFVNIGMTIGVMPITGVPLPFLSYGGSSLMMNMMLIGFLLNINAHRHEY